MDELTTLTKEQAYADLAAEQRLLFKCYPGGFNPIIFVKLNDHDAIRLTNYIQIFKLGQLADGALTTEAASQVGWGRYAWIMRDEEAYQFCLGILPYLVGTPKWRYCKECIDLYESNPD